jgi:hypothetical protein
VRVELNKKVLIGSVGYHNLSNYSVGPILLPAIREMDWPETVIIEELHWGPLAIVQYFESLTEPFDRVVILTALHDPLREVGDIKVHKWAGGLPSEEDIQARVCDAVTGVICVENLLVIGEYFEIWPEEVFLVDVEPGAEKYGDKLDPEVQEISGNILNLVRELSLFGMSNEYQFKYLSGEMLKA